MTLYQGRWDSRYEWKIISILSLAFGLVGLDRWIITPLFPAIMRDLHLNYSQIGALAGVLALCWGVTAVLAGGISDRIGRRRILIPAVIAFSVLAGLSGIAGSFGALLLIRGVMGATEGSFTPVSVAATAEASKPSRRGLNQGIQLSLFALLGMGLGPIIAVKLLTVLPSWRYVFLIVALPGFILAALIYYVLREPAAREPVTDQTLAAGGSRSWISALRSRNVILAVLGVLCTMCCVFVMGAMLPNYLIDYLHLTPSQMGFVMSALGFGGFVGDFAIPGLSDLIGRRTAAVTAFVGAAILVKVFAHTGDNPMRLFTFLFGIGFFGLGSLGLFTGPIATEAVPPALIASAVGIATGAGEIFGGGLAPTISGIIAQHYGIQHVLDLAFFGLCAGVVVSLGLTETAPRMSRQRLGISPGQLRGPTR
jgi:MFS family permease